MKGWAISFKGLSGFSFPAGALMVRITSHRGLTAMSDYRT